MTEVILFPVTCGVATHNLGTNRLLEALVEDLPSPALRGAAAALDTEGERVEVEPDESGDLLAYVFKTTADPLPGASTCSRVLRASVGHPRPERSSARRSGSASRGARG